MDNETRIARAQTALEQYDDEESALIDLLTDLRHWAFHNGHDMDECLFMSDIHYAEEVIEKGHGI